MYNALCSVQDDTTHTNHLFDTAQHRNTLDCNTQLAMHTLEHDEAAKQHLLPLQSCCHIQMAVNPKTISTTSEATPLNATQRVVV